MPDVSLLPAAPVVVLGLGSALAWGAADFGGGLSSRRAPVFGVTLVVQAVGVVLAALLWAGRGEPVPGPADVGWAAAAGIVGALGIAGLYRSLAVGRMSVVAPVGGVVAASLPVVAGILLEGLPPTVVLVGIGLALASVVLVSRVAEPGPAGGSSGISYALLAGLGLGSFSVLISRVGDGLVFGPLVIVRVVETAIFVAIVGLGRQPWRLPSSTRLVVLAVGGLDTLGNAAFIAATQAGALAVAAILSSLYPITTVILAAVVLRERISGIHALGVVIAIAAIALIAGGSA